MNPKWWAVFASFSFGMNGVAEAYDQTDVFLRCLLGAGGLAWGWITFQIARAKIETP